MGIIARSMQKTCGELHQRGLRKRVREEEEGGGKKEEREKKEKKRRKEVGLEEKKRACKKEGNLGSVGVGEAGDVDEVTHVLVEGFKNIKHLGGRKRSIFEQLLVPVDDSKNGEVHGREAAVTPGVEPLGSRHEIREQKNAVDKPHERINDIKG